MRNIELPQGYVQEPEDKVPTLADIERNYILNVLEGAKWNITEAAKRLRIGRATIYRKIKSYGIRISG